MAAEDDPGAVLHKGFDGGHGGADTDVIGDLLTVIQRHVEIHPHEHPLYLEVVFLKITNTPLLKKNKDEKNRDRIDRRRLVEGFKDGGVASIERSCANVRFGGSRMFSSLVGFVASSPAHKVDGQDF
ncbi:hypothetical protein GW17_00030681 [Ensete ventricosum]|uniref:Uncharacterized protein n=1 Tax=Ensete ventricosum TaxID=4639 RepID=A0A427AJ06_ENSVE|nr:hypothetical protein B296_00030401 [Ensete ventricosum]RWW06016.1 hypothetical protein GW17_00030681 [Ensete ventricosum]